MVHTIEEYRFIYQALQHYAQNKKRYDRILMSSKDNKNQSVEAHIELSIEEEDDIYLTRPEDVRRVLDLERNGMNDDGTRTISAEENSMGRTSNFSREEIEGTYVLSKINAKSGLQFQTFLYFV